MFLAVARSESLSRASKALRVDPATVGRRIARLEEQMHVPLFVKSPQGYVLSAAGMRLMPIAEQAEAVLHQTAEISKGGSGQGDASKLSGVVRIGAPDGCANFLLPQVCATLSDTHPDLDIQIVALPRVVNLSRREADMAITVSPPTAGRLSVQKVTEYRLHLAASDQYLAAAKPLLGLNDIAGHRVIGYIPDMIFDKELDYLAELGVTRVQLASNSVAVQFHWIRQGGGVGIVHDFALPSAPELKRVLKSDFSLTRAFYLVRHADDRRLPRMNRFADAFAAEVRKEVMRLEALA